MLGHPPDGVGGVKSLAPMPEDEPEGESSAAPAPTLAPEVSLVGSLVFDDDMNVMPEELLESLCPPAKVCDVIGAVVLSVVPELEPLPDSWVVVPEVIVVSLLELPELEPLPDGWFVVPEVTVVSLLELEPLPDC